MRRLLTALSLTSFVLTCSAAVGQEKKPTTARSEASMECSKQADEKGLHGKKRKTFRSKCLKDMKKKG
jgi:psiF repeat